MSNFIAAFAHEFTRHRRLMEQAMLALSDENFFRHPGPSVNSIALIVKHLSGNLASRWSDFLTSDGDKPARNRDDEFVLTEQDSRTNLMVAWDRAWSIVDQTLGELSDADLERVVTIRGEPHTVLQSLVRGVDHTAYHAGQILYVARLFQADAPYLTIAPGASRQSGVGRYLQPPGQRPV
jgi:uncharacterized damage-inducible protein DinB